MKSRKLINCKRVQVVFILALMVIAQPALALCIQSDPPADPVLAIDANNGCADIQGQEGCNIKDVDNGTCTYAGPSGSFTVNSWLNTDGSLSWALTSGSTLGIDTAMVGGGAKGKNNCGYSYKYDVTSGTGGDCKVTLDANGDCPGAFQNITSLDVCTDSIKDVEPPPPEEPPVATTLNSCQTQADFLAGTNGTLDDTGIQCPILKDALGVPIMDGNGDYQQAPVIVCNFEADKYAWGSAGANEAGATEEVCCKCGITGDTACFISDTKALAENIDENGVDSESGCTVVTTVDPTQEVTVQFNKDRGADPCTKIVSGGKVYKTCW